MKKRLVRLIPKFLRLISRIIYYIPLDIINRLKGRNSMIPPRSEIFVGDGDFEQIGQEFLKYFIELANLQANDKVLDVGCGIGRMAIPLTNYLSKENGQYWGFDIVKTGVEWCQNHISPKFNNFHFQHIDIYNGEYNPNGKVRSRDFQFPFNNEFFDFIFLTSVFTHMLPYDLENYLREISRVLKTGGKCLITFFILNKESRNLIRFGSSTLDFKYGIEGCLTTNKAIPEEAIAYDEEFITRLFEKYGLVIAQPVHYGSWCKRSNYLTYQDLIIAKKQS